MYWQKSGIRFFLKADYKFHILFQSLGLSRLLSAQDFGLPGFIGRVIHEQNKSKHKHTTNMRKLILSAVIAVTAMLMGPQAAEAGCCGPKLCLKKKVCTEEVCRRCYTKTRCVLGCPKTIHFVEITYRTTYRDCCGNCSYKTHTVTRRCR